MRKELLNKIVVNGLESLSDNELAEYYLATCEAYGLDPTARPFEFLTLNKNLQLYAKKGATDLLAATRKLTRTIVEGPTEVMVNGMKMIQAKCRVTAPDGRQDEDVGTVAAAKNTENAWMVCVTKAKRRATLSFLGLGMLDESELDQVTATPVKQPPAPPVVNLAAPPPPVESKPMPGALRGRIGLANDVVLAGMAKEVADASEEEKEAYAKRWIDIFKGYNEEKLTKALARLDAIMPESLKSSDAWEPVKVYLEQRPVPSVMAGQ